MGGSSVCGVGQSKGVPRWHRHEITVIITADCTVVHSGRPIFCIQETVFWIRRNTLIQFRGNQLQDTVTTLSWLSCMALFKSFRFISQPLAILTRQKSKRKFAEMHINGCTPVGGSITQHWQPMLNSTSWIGRERVHLTDCVGYNYRWNCRHFTMTFCLDSTAR